MIRNIKSLTGLRFIAAFYVFIFHVDMGFRTPLTYLSPYLRAIIEQGRLGVTIFFILSGFVLTYSHLKDYSIPKIKDKKYYFNFFYKRFARIYPIYLLGLVACILISIIFRNTPPFYIPLLSALLVQTYIPPIALLWYDSGAWSVVNEIFFYSLFPFILPLLLKIEHKIYIWLLLLCMIMAGVILGLGASDYLSFPFPFPFEWAFFFPPGRLPEFVAGILTALLVFKFNWKPHFLAVILLLFISVVYLIFAAKNFSGVLFHNWIIIPTVAFLLGELSKFKINPVFAPLESKLMQYLGKISYSFYITQLPLLIILDNLIAKEIVKHTNLYVGPVLFLLNLIIASFTYEYIEKKFHQFLINFRVKKI